ncbi:hypothetical protein [Skermania piniformis]|uniref:Secreted protein n=1 Tax=Skermania pinensis TaxID=39122 RepID=A0ABX8SA81_9ACTN|nr:hypothetical protein [Skermania piniformis]QXQ14211.1 hypothetical protein KV203_01875 [Skermania piniformis]
MFVRQVAAVATLTIGTVVALPAVGSAAPGDSGSALVDLGSAAVDLGSAVADLGSSIIGLPGPSGSGFRGGGGGLSAPPEQTLPCNASAQNGHDGITVTRHNIGRSGPTSFLLRWNTYYVLDRISVFYEGREIADTGLIGNANNPPNGIGSIYVVVPPGRDSFVDVQVDGGTDTDWEYTVNCP